MTVITASPTPKTRTPTRTWRRTKARDALASAGRKGTTMVSAARHHNWSPALTITGLAFLDTATFTTWGHGAGYAAIGISTLIFDWSRDR